MLNYVHTFLCVPQIRVRCILSGVKETMFKRSKLEYEDNRYVSDL